MHPDLLARDHDLDPPEDDTRKAESPNGDLPPALLGPRRVPLPAGLSLSDLAKLQTAEVDAKIQSHGAGIGYAAMIALACGVSDVPAGVQFHAAKFLMERAAELSNAGKGHDELMGRMRRLPLPQLLKFVENLEREALSEALEQTPDVITVDQRP